MQQPLAEILLQRLQARRDRRLGDVAEFFHFYAGCADKISGETLPIDKPDLFVFTQREPLGVIAAVVPL